MNIPSRGWQRVRALGERPWARHAVAILALALVHLTVFARSLFRQGAWPSVHIPWDFVDSYHRFLVFAGDSLRAGSLPLWYPYGEAGIPFFLNPQNQLWSPVTWLIGGLFGYDILTAQRQIILTSLMGGVGCYALATSLWRTRAAALFAALAYNFTAARVANCEHLDIVNAFAILPWLLWAMQRLAEGRTGGAVLLAFLGYLFLVSGYPGVVLLSPLWLGGWALFLAWEMTPQQRKRFLWGLGGAALLAMVLSAGYWLPQAVYRSAFGRGAPRTVQQALAQSLTVKDLSHLVFGVGLDIPPDGGNIDISMRGLYFGILALPLAVAAVAFRRDRRTAALGAGSFLALLMALGSSFYVRTAMHVWAGFLNLSRFPAVDSRAVAILGASLLAGAGLDWLVQPTDDDRAPAAGRDRVVGRVTVGLLVLLGIGLLLLRSTLFQSAAAPAFADRIAAPVILQGVWLVVAWVIYRRIGPGRRLGRAMLILAALDLGSQVHLNYFVVGQDAPPAFWEAMQGEHAARFDPAKAMVPRAQLAGLNDVRAIQGYTTKSFFLGTYGPFELRRFSTLIAAGFTDWLANGRRVVAFGGPIPDAGPAFAAGALPVDFTIDTYLPDRVSYTVNLPAPRTLVFNEVFFPGWKASTDGGPSVAMSEAAHGLRALQVPAGHHRIVTRFSPAVFWVGAALSLAGWLVAIACLALPALRRRRATA